MRKNSLLIMYTLNSMYHRFSSGMSEALLVSTARDAKALANTVLIPVIFLSQVLMPERR